MRRWLMKATVKLWREHVSPLWHFIATFEASAWTWNCETRSSIWVLYWCVLFTAGHAQCSIIFEWNLYVRRNCVCCFVGNRESIEKPISYSGAFYVSQDTNFVGILPGWAFNLEKGTSHQKKWSNLSSNHRIIKSSKSPCHQINKSSKN